MLHLQSGCQTQGWNSLCTGARLNVSRRSLCCLAQGRATQHVTVEAKPEVSAVPAAQSAADVQPMAPVTSSPSGTQGAASASKQVGNGQSVVELARADRNFKLIVAKSDVVLDRASAFGLAGGAVCLVVFGQDALDTIAQVTQLPLKEVDGIAYFLTAFSIVSAILPGGRYEEF